MKSMENSRSDRKGETFELRIPHPGQRVPFHHHHCDSTPVRAAIADTLRRSGLTEPLCKRVLSFAGGECPLCGLDFWGVRFEVRFGTCAAWKDKHQSWKTRYAERHERLQEAVELEAAYQPLLSRVTDFELRVLWHHPGTVKERETAHNNGLGDYDYYSCCGLRVEGWGARPPIGCKPVASASPTLQDAYREACLDLDRATQALRCSLCEGLGHTAEWCSCRGRGQCHLCGRWGHQASACTLRGELCPYDWACPKCGKVNFATRWHCFGCQAQKPLAQVSDVVRRPGDWICACGVHNFASRGRCYRCGQGRSGHDVVGADWRQGDWPCCACGVLNFARRSRCFRCHSERGGSLSAAP